MSQKDFSDWPKLLVIKCCDAKHCNQVILNTGVYTKFAVNGLVLGL